MTVGFLLIEVSDDDECFGLRTTNISYNYHSSRCLFIMPFYYSLDYHYVTIHPTLQLFIVTISTLLMNHVRWKIGIG